jgi:hypothetical protein
MATLPCVESRPHDRSIVALDDTREAGVSFACGGPSLLVQRTRASYGDSDARSNETHLAPERPE